jgi:hypothetical protein
MIQAVGTVFNLVGVLAIAVAVYLGAQTQLWLVAAYIGAIGLGALLNGLVLHTLGELSNTTRDLITAVLADPNDKPIQCPSCLALLTGDARTGKCRRCGTALPERATAPAT